MARRLLELMRRDGNIKIAMSQTELGALVGISRQSTNKILKRWESHAWIKRAYGGVEVCDPGALQGLSPSIF